MRLSLNSARARMRKLGAGLAQPDAKSDVSAVPADGGGTVRFQGIDDTLGEAECAFCHHPIFLDGMGAHS